LRNYYYYYYYYYYYVITFIQGIYNYIPDTNHVSRVYSVAAIVCLQYVVHVTVFPIETLCTLRLILSEVREQRSVCLFFVVPRRSIASMLFRHFLNYFEMVPVATIITGITLVHKVRQLCISIVKYLLLLLLLLLSSSATSLLFCYLYDNLYCIRKYKNLLTRL